MTDGFVKAASAAPNIVVADPTHNAEQIIEQIKTAHSKGVKLLVLPELCLTGSTCGDLFFQSHLLDAARTALKTLAASTAGLDMMVIVGLPISVESRLFSVAAVLYDGAIIGFVPRKNTVGTNFSPASNEAMETEIEGFGPIIISTELLFTNEAVDGFSVAVQFNADTKMPVSPAVTHCSAGATVIAVLSDEPASVFSHRKTGERLIVETERLCCAELYAAPGLGESTTDKVYSGFCAVAETGELLGVDEGRNSMAATEIDVRHISDMRMRERKYPSEMPLYTTFFWGNEKTETVLTRQYSQTPFVPDEELKSFCERALDIQAYGLIKRMEYTGLYRPVIGVSGGVDSTLVMIACARAMDIMKLPRENILAVTMPCFGTTGRTKNNAVIISERLGATLKIIPIGETVKKHFEAIGHEMDDYSVVFENAQARERTMVLLNLANKVGGLNVGTKDLSEQADGWCTFNGDQISNYDINAGLTKTMVKAIVRYEAENCEDAELANALLDILDTPVTPELLPISEQGDLLQKSEDSVGPYILQDFFLYHMIMRGAGPTKVLRIAQHSFGDKYSRETLVKWLKSYTRRMFSQQFKRSTTADGPAVMGFTFSPRDGFKMPSDASGSAWLHALEEL